MSLESRIGFQYFAPQRLFAKIAHFCAEHRTSWFKNMLIRYFLSKHAVNMQESELEDPYAYPTFNQFFTRALKSTARPIASEGLVSPADGILSQYGDLEKGMLVQAKGQWFLASELLGDPTDNRFDQGSFLTVYLAPKNYHRVHLPIAGKLLRMRYIPGRLLSVSNCTAEEVPRLFSRNERVVAWFETEYGTVAVVLVGAMIVGSIYTKWHGVVNPQHMGTMQTWDYPDLKEFTTGANIGHFCLGSTVIVLTEQQLHFNSALSLGKEVKMGEQIAYTQKRNEV